MTETKTQGGVEEAIDAIGQIDGLRAFAFPADHPALVHWFAPNEGLLHRIAHALDARGLHTGRTVVVLPYAQLLNLAQRLWSRAFPDGFSPRFETSRNWAAQLGVHPAGPTDITLNVALDTLTAGYLVGQAGGGESTALCELVVEAAHALAPLAAGMVPADRAAWAEQARCTSAAAPAPPALSVELRATRIAIEWAAQSAYPTDVLFEAGIRSHVDAIVLVEGLAPDPLHKGLQSAWADRCITLSLLKPHDLSTVTATDGVGWHRCADAEDEAQRACALMLQHITAGRYPLALVSSDRALTRRIRAMLEHAGVAVRDETGWKLSTTRVTSHVMTLLGAATWNATSDQVMELLKLAPAWRVDADAIEAKARKRPASLWLTVRGLPALQEAGLQATLSGLDQVRALFKGAHTLTVWLGLLQQALTITGVTEIFAQDAAGESLRRALWLDSNDSLRAELEGALWADNRMDLADFSGWVNRCLEHATFQQPYPQQEQVVFLPLNQLLARPFAAVVLAGCDEVRLLPSPEPGGPWSPAQRTALGLPGREEIALATRMAWNHALQMPDCNVLWRTSDAAGEQLQASALVQLAQSGQQVTARALQAPDPRLMRTVTPAPVGQSAAVGAALAVSGLSASGYDNLRQCPYRFFALQQLGLSPAEELDAEVDKRDFGLWLHAVLEHFHASLASHTPPGTSLSVLIDASSDHVTRQMGLPTHEFLPFMAAWPAVRDGYLHWWTQHQSEGAAFETGELSARQQVGDITLRGRVDRVDRLPQGVSLVVDYKTEPLAKTRERVKDPMEDTQIAFYAALIPNEQLRAAYVNVGERDGTTLVEQKDLAGARHALVAGIQNDMERIRQGTPLVALGDGPACDYCQARGLCRKDFWSGA